MSDMEEAKDKVLMGPERRSMLISDSEKKVIAFHEAGPRCSRYFDQVGPSTQGDHNSQRQGAWAYNAASGRGQVYSHQIVLD